VDLFLSEPQVIDPVEMAFDEDGRIYVAEMLDYPDDPPRGEPARSRIRLLEDRDGDGSYERAVVFADRLLQVSGLLPWKGGLFVTCAPDILYLQDSDGDGAADQRRVLYTGFPLVNPEARVTNLRLGIDNWIYASNTGSDGRITSPEPSGHAPVLARGADFRFHPVRGLAEAASGAAQFGSTFDEWGNRYITQNTIHLRQVVVPMRYLARTPLLEIPALAADISDHGRPNVRIYPLTRPQRWREERTRARQQRYQQNQLNRREEVGGFFTAATGGTVYTGDAFPEEYRGNVFTGDVNGNLVHRDVLAPDGVTFSARRARDGVEFLASTDVWFRPANFANAPDGNLYMMDMYREFIETPESIPEQIKKGMNFWSGDTMGRIYRISPNHPRLKRHLKPALGQASVAGLVGYLAHPNGWHRQTAQRLLVERQDQSAVPPLREMAAKHASAVARLHALWTLEGLDALEPALLRGALGDSEPRLREHALRLSEPFLGSPGPLARAVLGMANDPDTRVQFQLSLTLGELRDRSALEVLARIADRRSGDPWFRIAILSSAGQSPAEFYRLVSSRSLDPEFLEHLASLIGARRQPAELAAFLRSRPHSRALAGLAKGLRLAGAYRLRVPAAEAALARLIESGNDEMQRAAWDTARYFELGGLLRKAAAEALDSALPAARRAAAIRALSAGAFGRAAGLLKGLLASNPAPELQVAALDALASFADPEVAPTLLSGWRSYSPEARARALNALLHYRERVPVLLQALEGGSLETSALDVAMRARLLESRDPEIAGRARALLAARTTDRARVVESHRAVLELDGDAGRGKLVFDEHCARCHLPRQQGGRVGPDLSGVNNKTREELLTSILNPSYSVEPRFVNYLVTTRDGRLFDGVIAGETPGAITLRGGSEEGDQTILRGNVSEVRASSVSLMPDELEKSLNRQHLADVIAYLRAGL